MSFKLSLASGSHTFVSSRIVPQAPSSSSSICVILFRERYTNQAATHYATFPSFRLLLPANVRAGCRLRATSVLAPLLTN
jgi:hypothetical protein